MIFKKIRREILVALSMMALKSASISRGGRKYRIPLINGMGRWLFMYDKEIWRAKVFATIPATEESQVLDIGINVGQSLLDFHEQLPNAQYYGFEPNPACVFYLNELIRRNSLENKTILPFGLNERKEILSLMSKGWDDASSSVVSHRGKFYKTTIYTTTGDDAVSEMKLNNIPFIKIDVEGFELSVLKGFTKTLQDQKPILFCEVNEGSKDQEELFSYMTALDYDIFAQSLNQKAVKIEGFDFESRVGNDYVMVHSSKSESWLKLL